MSLFALKFSEQTSRPMADLDDAEVERVEGVVRHYGEALHERVRVVSAMRLAAVTLDEIAKPCKDSSKSTLRWNTARSSCDRVHRTATSVRAPDAALAMP